MIIPIDILLKTYHTFDKRNNTIRPTGRTCESLVQNDDHTCNGCPVQMESYECGLMERHNPDLSYSLQLLYDKYPEMTI